MRKLLPGFVWLMCLPALLSAQTPLRAVTSTGMIADAVRAVGGPHVEVLALMGADIDPHSYRLTRSDIVTLTRADLVLWNGLYLEAQLEDFMHNLARKRPVIAIAEKLPRSVLRAHDDYKEHYDPHVWMDLQLWSRIIDEITIILSETRPQAAPDFEDNAAVYKTQLADMDTYAREVLAQVPPAARVLLTAHDAFGYFGAAYGYEVIGVQGISTASEAGILRIRTLVDLLVRRDINAIFVESSVSDRNLRALIEGARAQEHNVNIGGVLYADAMGEPGTYEGTYLGMMDHNVTTIARALGARIPARGMAGRLEQDQ